MDVNVVRDFLAVHLRAEHRILKHQIFGHDAGLENLTAAVNVLDVGVDGFDALLETAPQQVPFLGRDDARNDIEGDQAFLRLGIAIDGKGDADAAEQQLGFAAAEIEDVGFDFGQPLRQFGIGRPHVVPSPIHFVEHVDTRPLPSQTFAASTLVAVFNRSKLCANSRANRADTGRGINAPNARRFLFLPMFWAV